MPDPSLAGIQSLDADELNGLIGELLEAEGASLAPVTQEEPASQPAHSAPLLLTKDGELRLVEAHRSQRTPLGRVSLPAIAARAAKVGATSATIYLSGVLDAERQMALSQVLSRVQNGTGISINLVDAVELLARLDAQPKLAARYFPSETDAENAAVQQHIPPALVRVAYAVAPKPRSETPRARHERLRLAWTAGGVLFLTWLPLKLDPDQARLFGGIGVALIVLAVLVAQLAARTGGPGRRADSVMDALIPIKDEQAVGRSVTMARLGNGPVGIMLATLKQMPGALVRSTAKTALFLFLIGCSCTYLLLWGIEPGTCSSTTNCGHAFVGHADHARVGDFMNLAVNAAFFNLPNNLEPASPLARALVDTEFILSAVLLGSYAAFFGFGRLERGRDAET